MIEMITALSRGVPQISACSKFFQITVKYSSRHCSGYFIDNFTILDKYETRDALYSELHCE